MSRRRRGGAKLLNPGETQTTDEGAEAETSRLWAELRLAVVGHLVVGDLERGQLVAELKSLSAEKWKPRSREGGSTSAIRRSSIGITSYLTIRRPVSAHYPGGDATQDFPGVSPSRFVTTWRDRLGRTLHGATSVIIRPWFGT